MRKAFRYRLCPTKAQETELFNQLRLCRNLYNAGLCRRQCKNDPHTPSWN